ncbi:PREDICTED: uncharacterized protein LOC109473241 [Branchiostoma belcheri]|uniref:Uncharacterized protein LOC109473241 n=1 Tax=Branchiostoma belcheri TaxID=7741 RepID=A0A6P4ZG87_BRABE|nr:PREDICTED: uncharacterized protein LOC109473241 [Branchiostoma belcheri]
MNVELIDAPENSAEGIITIIKRLNKLLVPQTGGEDSTAVERIVLGGDVLTNERAFSGQAALMNADNEKDSCAGIIHRPEGLHRLMNFLMGIYQEFYKEPVTGDRALPYSLRNIVNRRDVEGPKSVAKAYRSHLAFVVDCVDAYTVAMACQHFGLSSIDGKPTANTPPVLHGTDKSGKCLWLLQQAKTIRKQLLSPGDHEKAMDIDHMTQQVAALDNRQQMLQTVQQEDGKYKCPHCGKEYVREKNFTKHQEKVHSIDLHVDTVPAEGQEHLQYTSRLLSSFPNLGVGDRARKCLNSAVDSRVGNPDNPSSSQRGGATSAKTQRVLIMSPDHDFAEGVQHLN